MKEFIGTILIYKKEFGIVFGIGAAIGAGIIIMIGLIV